MATAERVCPGADVLNGAFWQSTSCGTLTSTTINWERKVPLQPAALATSGLATLHGPHNVKLSDNVVIWAVIYMDCQTRGDMFPADFDTHGEIRQPRQLQGRGNPGEGRHGIYGLGRETGISAGSVRPMDADTINPRIANEGST